MTYARVTIINVPTTVCVIGTKLTAATNARQGMAAVSAARMSVETSSTVPGLLLKNGRRVRTKLAMVNSVSNDSTKQPDVSHRLEPTTCAVGAGR